MTVPKLKYACLEFVSFKDNLCRRDNIIKYRQLNNEVRILEFDIMITQPLGHTYSVFGVFPFFQLHYKNYGSFNKRSVFAMMNSSSLHIFSTRHVIYSVSEKVCLRNIHNSTDLNVQNHSPSAEQ